MKHRTTNLDPAQPVEDKTETETTVARPASAHKSEARLGREVQARIGQQLRAMYNEVVNQGVPQHIADLVRRLGDEDRD